MRMMIFALLMGLVLTPAFAAGVFTYERRYNGSGGFGSIFVDWGHPTALMWADGRLHVGDADDNVVYILTPNDTVEKRLGKFRQTATIHAPQGMAKQGNTIYIADSGRQSVVTYRSDGFYGEIGPTLTDGKRPSAVWVEGDVMWVLSSNTNEVRSYNITTDKPLGRYLDSGSGTDGLSGPQDIKMKDGRIYIADTDNNRVQVYDREWNYLDSIGTGRGGVALRKPTSIAIEGDRLYVADSANDRVAVFGLDGYPLETLAGNRSDNRSFGRPWRVAVGGGRLYVLDTDQAWVIAYRLDWENGSTGPAAKLEQARREVNTYQATTLAWMDALGLAHAPFAAPGHIEAASEYLAAGEYLKSAEQVQKATDELERIRAGHIQALRLGIQKRIDAAQALVQEGKSLNLSIPARDRRDSLSAQAAEAQAYLDLEQYAPAVERAAAIPALSATLQADYGLVRGTGTGTAPKPPASSPGSPPGAPGVGLAAQIEAQRARLVALEQRLAQAHMERDLATAWTLLNSSQALMEGGALEQANATVASARRLIDSTEAEAGGQMDRVAAARKAVDEARAVVEGNRLAAQALGIDQAPILEKLKAAEGAIYSDPASAITLANQTAEMSRASQRQVKDRGGALGAGGLVVGGIVALIIGVWLLMKGRPKEGLGAPTPARKPEAPRRRR